MANILFVIIPEKGHINPYIGPARELQRRGHTVAFYAVHDVSAQLKRAGFSRCFSVSGLPPAEGNRGAEFAANVRDGEWLRNWIKSLLVDAVSVQVEPLRAIIRGFKAELLVIDPMVYQGAIAAQLEGLPWFGISSSLNPVVPDDIETPHIANNRRLAAERDQVFRAYGLEADFRVCDCLSPCGTLVLSTPEFIPWETEGVTLAGPTVVSDGRGDEAAFPWDKLSSRPLIYMSLGSQIYHQPRMYAAAIEAVRGKPVQLVLAAQDLAPALTASGLPENVLAVGYAPQLQLLKRARAVITHGGANSLMEALTFGVPLLVTAICNDQFHNAIFVERAGCGMGLNLDAATPEQCWGVLEHLLNDERVRERSACISESYLAHDGSRGAADFAERLLRPEDLNH